MRPHLYTTRLRRALPALMLLLLAIAVARTGTVAGAPLAGASLTPRSPFLASTAAPRLWFKGNTHTHTLNSDGDSTPDEVVRWYRENGYQFLVLTDHNFLTAVDGLNALFGAAEKFLVIRGEEVTDTFGDKPLHINGLDVGALVAPQGGTSVTDVLQRNVEAIRKVDGIPHINHPNFLWAITTDDLKPLRRDTLIEIFNGHPTVNNLGGGGVPGLEEVWDRLLTAGQEIYGIAVDDAHVFKRPWDRSAARPGQGWVVVRAATLAPRDIVTALDRGEFYASNGVELENIAVTPTTLTVTIKADPQSKYRTQFIGRDGRLLKEILTTTAAYDFTGDEGYVRARVLDSNGHTAWVQPVFLTSAATSSR